MGIVQDKQNNHQQRKVTKPAKPHKNAANKGVGAELSDEAIRNLTGFFDVLIQMDFASNLRNETRSNDERPPLKHKIIEQVDNWCVHCQFQVVNHLLWNADADLAEEIARAAVLAAYQRCARGDNDLTLTNIFSELAPHSVKDIRDVLNNILENKTKADPFSD